MRLDNHKNGAKNNSKKEKNKILLNNCLFNFDFNSD